MYKLNIEATEKSPSIIFDPENFLYEMEGNSRPENVRDFYYPIIGSLKSFFNSTIENAQEFSKFKDKVFKFNFKLDYFNSASAKFISDILLLVQKYSGLGFDIKIYWYFLEGDDDMKEVGEDFSEMVDFPFNYIMIR